MIRDHYVTYSVTEKQTGVVHNRRTGPFGEDTADANAKDLARRENISHVVVETWAMVSSREVPK